LGRGCNIVSVLTNRAAVRSVKSRMRKHKDILGKIDSDSDNSHGLPLSNELMRHLHFPSWHFVAGRRNTRPGRDGEVRSIR